MSGPLPNGTEFVLGFDARAINRDLSSEWPPARRSRYLIRPDIGTPLSVDPLAWPSIVDKHDPVRLTFGLSAIALKSQHSQQGEHRVCVPAWPCLATLEQYAYDRVPGAHACCWLIAITRLVSDTLELARSCPSGSIEMVDTAPEFLSDWERLGYDVADQSLLSRLLNCGFTEQSESLAAREMWGRHLNRHHLFDDIAVAADYATATSSRVAEHAPFFVHGLYVRRA